MLNTPPFIPPKGGQTPGGDTPEVGDQDLPEPCIFPTPRLAGAKLGDPKKISLAPIYWGC